MSRIQTVLGSIAPGELGFCQSHEHLCILPGQPARCNPALRIEDLLLSARELMDYHAKGGCGIVDAQPLGCGRDPLFLREISQRSGVHIIASTGFHKQMFYPNRHWIHDWSQERLARLFESELRQGMFLPADDGEPEIRTHILAGQLKAALEQGWVLRRGKALLGACAAAQKKTGAPLMIHTDPGCDPLAAADFLEAQGVELHRVAFCHMDRTEADLSVHWTLCKRGAYMEYDTVAREKYHTDEHELEIIAALLDAGYQSQLLVSLDVTRERLLHYGGQIGLCYILAQFIPRCLAYGIPQKTLQAVFLDNPSRFFSI